MSNNPADQLTQQKNSISIYEKELVDITQKISDLSDHSKLTSSTDLRNGYPKRWELYRQVWAESISICNEIKRIIECYEKIVFDKIDESILTNKGIVKLDRKEKGFDLFPTKFNFESFYVYPKLLSEIFQEVKNREEGKKKQILWIKGAGDYEHLVIGSTDENNEREETLAYGDMKIMEELKKRVDILLDESELKRLICQYYEQKSRLQTRENLDQFDEEIKTMWDKINYNGFFVRGEGCCTNVHTCKSKPKGDFGEIDYA